MWQCSCYDMVATVKHIDSKGGYIDDTQGKDQHPHGYYEP